MLSTMFRQAGRAIVMAMFCALAALYISDLSASTDQTKPPRVQNMQQVMHTLNVPPVRATIPPPPPPPPPGPPPKICHCADDCPCGHACYPKCTCVVAAPATEASYDAQRQAAIAANTPLIVWVGTRNPATETEMAECTHAHVDHFPGAAAPCIIVSRPIAGDLYRLADLPATASAFRIGQATAAPATPEAPPVAAAAVVPVMFRPVAAPQSMAFRPRLAAAACST